MQNDPSFFRDLELRRTRALVEKNSLVLEELHSQDYQLITPSGKVFSRERYLDMIVNGTFYSNWEVGEMFYRITSDMAVIRYTAKITFPSGKVVTCWHTDSYENISNAWQAVWSQATEVGS